MKTLILFSLATLLSAAAPADVIHSLERFPGRSDLKTTLHIKSRVEHPKLPKEPIQETRQDLSLRFENGELWIKKTSDSCEVAESELRQILDPRPLIRGWMNSEPIPSSVTPNGEPLAFKIKPEIPPRLKRLWESEGHLEVWLAQDGSPSRAVLLQRYKGRVQRIAPTEEVTLRIEYTFKVEGDHLLLVRMDETREEHDGYDITKRNRVLELRN